MLSPAKNVKLPAPPAPKKVKPTLSWTFNSEGRFVGAKWHF